MATQSVPMQLVLPGLAQVLSDSLRLPSAVGFGGVLTGMWAALYTAGPPPNIGNSLGQYTEANYSGYARQQVVWGDQGIDVNGRPAVTGSALMFQPTGAAVSNTVIGALLCSAQTGGQLLAVGQLTSSKVMGTTVDVLTILPRFAVPGVITPVDWGEIVGVD